MTLCSGLLLATMLLFTPIAGLLATLRALALLAGLPWPTVC
jgi:hypothetical protein